MSQNDSTWSDALRANSQKACGAPDPASNLAWRRSQTDTTVNTPAQQPGQGVPQLGQGGPANRIPDVPPRNRPGS
jgi:hypothetical protein